MPKPEKLFCIITILNYVIFRPEKSSSSKKSEIHPSRMDSRYCLDTISHQNVSITNAKISCNYIKSLLHPKIDFCAICRLIKSRVIILGPVAPREEI